MMTLVHKSLEKKRFMIIFHVSLYVNKINHNFCNLILLFLKSGITLAILIAEIGLIIFTIGSYYVLAWTLFLARKLWYSIFKFLLFGDILLISLYLILYFYMLIDTWLKKCYYCYGVEYINFASKNFCFYLSLSVLSIFFG